MEERLMEEYIGKDAEKLMNDKYNWSAAILGQMIGPVWFFYRKAPLLGFLFLIITYVVGSIATAIGLEEASYIMFFIYLLTANKLYLWDVRRKVYKIDVSESMTDDEKIEAAAKKGGTSPFAAVLYVLLFIAFMIYYVYISIMLINAAYGL